MTTPSTAVSRMLNLRWADYDNKPCVFESWCVTPVSGCRIRADDTLLIVVETPKVVSGMAS